VLEQLEKRPTGGFLNYKSRTGSQSVTLRPMSAPLVPSPLDYIGRRRFSFYPPIKSFQANEWILGVSSWSEVQAVNPSTGAEIWIPRQYIGAVGEPHGSSIEPNSGAMLVVALREELEYRQGALSPRLKRVIEMPHKVDKHPKLRSEETLRPPGPAPVVGIRIEAAAPWPKGKALATLGIALIVSLLAALYFCTRSVIVP